MANSQSPSSLDLTQPLSRGRTPELSNPFGVVSQISPSSSSTPYRCLQQEQYRSPLEYESPPIFRAPPTWTAVNIPVAKPQVNNEGSIEHENEVDHLSSPKPMPSQPQIHAGGFTIGELARLLAGSRSVRMKPCQVKKIVLWMKRNGLQHFEGSRDSYRELLMDLRFQDADLSVELQHALAAKVRRKCYDLGRTLKFNGAVKVEIDKRCREKAIYAGWTDRWLASDWDGSTEKPEGWMELPQVDADTQKSPRSAKNRLAKNRPDQSLDDQKLEVSDLVFNIPLFKEYTNVINLSPKTPDKYLWNSLDPRLPARWMAERNWARDGFANRVADFDGYGEVEIDGKGDSLMVKRHAL